MDVMDTIGQAVEQKTRWPLVEQALILFYSGQAASLKDAVESIDGLARSTFYLYRDEYPDEFAVLETRVKQQAVAERRDIELAFSREQLDASIEAQRQANAAVLELLPTWVEIARGDVRVVMATGKDGKTKEKRIVPYARDMLEAAKLLVGLAQNGLLTENGRRLAVAQAPAAEPKQIAPPEPEPEKQQTFTLSNFNGDFTSLTAIANDGTVVHASVSSPVDVDGEIVDVQPESDTTPPTDPHASPDT